MAPNNTRTNCRKSKRNLSKKYVSNKSSIEEVNLTNNNADLIVSHSVVASEVAVIDYNENCASKNCSSSGVANNGVVLQNMVGCATYDDQDNSELVDDPRILPQVIMDIREDELISIDSNSNLVTEDPDVVLLCEKARSHEVITLVSACCCYSNF